MRRDSSDIQWQQCKKKVFELDGYRCCLCKCATVKELMQFKKSMEGELDQTKIIDPAHYKSVSTHTQNMYDPNNVFCLCRTMHNRIDYVKDPYTGQPITLAQREEYWQRIIKTRQKNGIKKESVEDSFFYEELD